MGLPKFGLAGLLLSMNGELAWVLLLYDADPCTVRPSVTRAMTCSSPPLTR